MKGAIKILLLMLFLSANFCEANAQYPGTNLRGRVMTTGYYGQTPLVYASVDLYYYRQSTGKWLKLQNTVTDAYGFYYLNNVKHNHNYVIQVNGYQNYNVKVDWIDYRYYQYQDMPIFYY